jgi:hypothetical protein
VIIDNVFKEILNVCKSRYSGSDLVAVYNKLVSNVLFWSDDLYEKELINILSTHSHFEEVLGRSFMSWTKSFYKKSNKTIEMKPLNKNIFIRTFINKCAKNKYILNFDCFYNISTLEQKDVCMDIIRDSFMECSNDFIHILEDNETIIDEINPCDSISNVCLGD